MNHDNLINDTLQIYLIQDIANIVEDFLYIEMREINFITGNMLSCIERDLMKYLNRYIENYNYKTEHWIFKNPHNKLPSKKCSNRICGAIRKYIKNNYIFFYDTDYQNIFFENERLEKMFIKVQKIKYPNISNHEILLLKK